MVLMIQMGISLDDIRNELASRHVIDHKVDVYKRQECCCTDSDVDKSVKVKKFEK